MKHAGWGDQFPVVLDIARRDPAFARLLGQAINNGLPTALIPYYTYVYEENGLYGIATMMVTGGDTTWKDYLDSACVRIAKTHMEHGSPRARELGLNIQVPEDEVRRLCDKMQWEIEEDKTRASVVDIDGSTVVVVNAKPPSPILTKWDLLFRELEVLL